MGFMDIFAGTHQHEYYLELARAEVLQEHLQAQRNILLTIIQARFPTLVKSAKVLARQIKDLSVLDELVGKVGAT
jgi:hypothetical protein